MTTQENKVMLILDRIVLWLAIINGCVVMGYLLEAERWFK